MCYVCRRLLLQVLRFGFSISSGGFRHVDFCFNRAGWLERLSFTTSGSVFDHNLRLFFGGCWRFG